MYIETEIEIDIMMTVYNFELYTHIFYIKWQTDYITIIID